MSYETINVTPVTPRIGADVDGLTLAKPLSNRTAPGRNSKCDFVGGPTRSHFGTIAAFNTWRCGTITPMSDPVAA
jgi:hypothetical protein